MTSEEEQQMLAKIGHLAGQINRRKNQQAGIIPTREHHHGASNRGGYSRGRGASAFHHNRGSRIGKTAVHRHRSLLLNGNGPGQSTKSDASSDIPSDASSSSWVTKNDRHLQIINSNIYDKDSQARVKQMEETRKNKMRSRDDHERRQLKEHLGRLAQSSVSTTTTTADTPAAMYELTVQGIRFHVTKNGSKLVKVPGAYPNHLQSARITGDSDNIQRGVSGDPHPSEATPKVATVGGVKFYRTKNGNLYRHGVLKAQRQSEGVRKVNQPCRAFSTTGSCSKGPQCRYIHDAFKVAACREFMQKGECGKGNTCDLSHELTPERTPTCLHFAKGYCSNPDCRYTHSAVSLDALLCRSFGILGFCEKGAECPDRHMTGECPDFSNTGVCKTKNCKLAHRERASVLRKAKARDGSASDTEDLSSDDEHDSVDSNDVDSDEVEEWIGESGSPDMDFALQKDFIAF